MTLSQGGLPGQVPAIGEGPMPHRIFLVDDQKEFLQLAHQLLSADPRITVVGQATSGDEALALMPALRPDAVILDVAMPGTDGFQVARRLLQRYPQVQVIMISVTDHPEYSALAERAGAVAFLNKRALSVDAVVNALLRES